MLTQQSKVCFELGVLALKHENMTADSEPQLWVAADLCTHFFVYLLFPLVYFQFAHVLFMEYTLIIISQLCHVIDFQWNFFTGNVYEIYWKESMHMIKGNAAHLK